MKYLSVCSGIEAASSAWEQLGWKAFAYSEIEAFPSATLAHHYPDVPNLGDMTKFKEWPDDTTIDVLVGGTPCQSFSVAGLRKGLDDARGNLMLTYAGVARKYRPRWLVWENVPGVLSSEGGRDFASLLGILSGRHIVAPAEGWQNIGIVPGIESGYGLAWRVLDAQYLGVPQRRRRVFVVGHLGDWRRAAAVLFERQSLRGDSPPSRKAGQRIAPAVTSGAANGSAGHGARSGSAKEGLIEVVSTMSESSGHARPGDNIQSVDYLIPAVANPLTARMHKGVNTTMDEGQTMVLAFDTTQLTHPANANGGGQAAVAFKPSHFTRDKDGAPSDVVPPLSADADKGDQDTLVAVGRSGDIAATLQGSVGGNGNAGNGSEAIVAIAYDDRNQAAASDVHHTLRGDGVGSRVGDAVAFESRFARNGRGAPSEVVPPLKAQPGQTGKGDAAPLVVALHENQRSETHESDTLQALNSGGGKPGQGYPAIRYDMQVRRLTPRECERLQGFPDDYTLIQNRGKPAADGPRYKALGNSMAVPVMRWIGERIQEVDKLGCVTEQRRAGDEQ